MDVFRYNARDDDHSELTHILGLVARFLASGSVSPARLQALDVKKAQALYFWERFRPARAGNAPADAYQAVIVQSLDARPMSAQNLADRLNELGIRAGGTEPVFQAALAQLVEAGWIQQDGSNLSLPAERLGSPPV